MPIETIGTATPRGLQQSLLQNGSLIDEDFYRLHRVTDPEDDPIPFSRILDKIGFCERRLLDTEELMDYEKALSFSAEGISLVWINSEDVQPLAVSSCSSPTKAVHIGPFRYSPWAAPISFFQGKVLDELKEIHQHRDRMEIFCLMTMQVVCKDNGSIFAKVGIK